MVVGIFRTINVLLVDFSKSVATIAEIVIYLFVDITAVARGNSSSY
jgi:hypothetical protein